jgi:hypothetical protein
MSALARRKSKIGNQAVGSQRFELAFEPPT